MTAETSAHPFPAHGQPFDVLQPIRSESAQWMGSQDDTEVCVRICRYPSVGLAWVWAHVWMPGRRLGYNIDAHRCDSVELDVDGEDVEYSTTDIACAMRRTGPSSEPREVRVSMAALFHDDAHAPNRPGDVRVRIDATFVSGALSAAPMGGRQEVRGETTAIVDVAGTVLQVRGHGHWHEQLQTAPRWLVGFTYLSLRGGDTSLVATRVRAGTRGFVQRGDDLLRITGCDIDPPGPRRNLRLELEDGSAIAGEAVAVHTGSVYLYGRRRPASRVSVDGGRLVGTINDWEPGQA